MSADEDSDLMVQVAKGNRHAFARLFDRHQASVVRFCHRFVGDAARAEELAQDVFIKLYRGAAGYQPTAKFKTYLFRIATNHCLNELRRPAWSREQVEDRVADDVSSVVNDAPAAETPDQLLEARDVERALHRAMKKMSERERAAFTMCRFEGMAYRDIAEALEASESAVKSLIHRATVQVMNHLEALKASSPVAGVAHG